MNDNAVTSEILDASTIVQVVIDEADLGPWRDGAPGRQVRSVTLAVRLADVLRGSLTEAPRSVVTLEVHQERLASGRPVGSVGLWSRVPVDVGARLLAFSRVGGDLADALAEEHLLRLEASGPVLADLRLALSLQREHPTADALLEQAERHHRDAGGLFARYVWTVAREALRTSIDRFDRLMRVAEHPETDVRAQRAYLVNAYLDMTQSAEFDTAHRARLARAMLRAALDPHLGALRSHLLQVFVPNLVRAPVPEPLTPADVFAGAGPGDSAVSIQPEGAGAAGTDTTAADATAVDVTTADGAGLRAAVLAALDDVDPATTSPALRDWLTGGKD
ncbi:hypothetical protein [Occultella gossypii]|uniref:Uncharacterized protein n=1 Tax=Occultella gossypii TaxID=2800820 RepID=A0ABS7SK51_9MICO|nr:hypothetical protein [Occultella gossypii]MBZ2199658.1 hypothetical protein [Occultella gossypii]